MRQFRVKQIELERKFNKMADNRPPVGDDSNCYQYCYY